MDSEPTPSPEAPQDRVLIVEDDIFLADLICRKFQDYFIVLHAGSVAQARDIVASEAGAIDLICLDIQLPGENGIVFLEEVRKNEKLKSVPVLIISNFSQDDEKKRAKDAGATDYIVKANVDLNEIVTKGKELIAAAKKTATA